MGVRMMDLLSGNLDTLRYEPTAKRVRVCVGGEPVADTCEARLVWEPRRVVPTYAVPITALTAQLVPAGAESGADEDVGVRLPAISSRPILDPTVPSTPTHVRAPRSTSSPAKRPAPRRRSGPTTPTSPTTSSSSSTRSNGVRRTNRWSATRMTRSAASTSCAAAATSASSWTARLLAETQRPMLLFETLLPVRFYLPREDVAVRLEPSDTASYCAYKGRASYYSLPDGPRDVAWTYHEPLHDAEPVRDRICFFDERVDVTVDGERRDRPVTPWSDQ